MIELVPLLVLGFAAYRITRFFIIDTMFSGTRNKMHSVFVNNTQKQGKTSLLWEKLYDLTSCTFCAGFWVSLGLYWLFIWNSPTTWDQYDIISIFAIAAVQSLLHVIEPEDT
jgi:Protein of unknown function (DUF1360)